MFITRKFNAFAGREVHVHEKTETVIIGGGTYSTPVYTIDKNDPTVKAMQKLAENEGFVLSIHLPGAISTMDIRDDRINATLKKERDGKWRVQKGFSIG